MIRFPILMWVTFYLVGCASLTSVNPAPEVNRKSPTRVGNTTKPISVLQVKLTLKQVNGEFGPRTEVVLSVLSDKPEHHLLANVDATCSQHREDITALSEVRCWHAGAGQNFTVRQQENSLVVSRTDVSEEEPETLTTVIHRIQVPQNRTVHLVN